jgi:hypothetical protein
VDTEKKETTMVPADDTAVAEAEAGFDPNAPPAGEAVEGLRTEEGEGYSFDMSQEKASSGYPVTPAGTYDAVVADCQFKISQNSGNPMWQIKWSFPFGEGDKVKNRTITSFVVFSADQRGRAKMTVKRIAPELAELTNFDPKVLAPQIVGKPARIKINIQPGQDGEDRSNVAEVLAPAAGGGGSFNL